MAFVTSLLISLSLFFAPETIPNASEVNEINWMTFEEAVAASKKNPKKILIDVYTVWCGPCKRMNEITFKNPAVVEYVNKNYYAVKFNAEGNDTIRFMEYQFTNPNYDENKKMGRNGTHELTTAIAAINGRISYPTVVYMDESFKILSPVPGFIQPKEMEPILRFFAENHHLTTKWETYQQNFEGSF